MEWTLPGTVLSVDADRPQAAEEVFFFPVFSRRAGAFAGDAGHGAGAVHHSKLGAARLFGAAEAAQVHAPPVEPHLDDQRVEKHAFHRADLQAF
mgnify:CR=1 FL=1